MSPSHTVPTPDLSVGAQTHGLSEQELDFHIRDCGRRMVAAQKAGDKADMEQWRDRMYDAIKSRSPEHQARLTARIDSAIWFQSDEALAIGREAP